MAEYIDHPEETLLAEYLAGSLSTDKAIVIEEHISSCGKCLEAVVASHESVRSFRKNKMPGHKKDALNGAGWVYPAMAAISFALSFIMPQHFFQFLAACLVFGIKWVVDSKTTKMLITIHEALKKSDDKEAPRILEKLGIGPDKKR